MGLKWKSFTKVTEKVFGFNLFLIKCPEKYQQGVRLLGVLESDWCFDLRMIFLSQSSRSSFMILSNFSVTHPICSTVVTWIFSVKATTSWKIWCIFSYITVSSSLLKIMSKNKFLNSVFGNEKSCQKYFHPVCWCFCVY